MYAILYVSTVHVSTVFRQVSNPAANQTPGMRGLPVPSTLRPSVAGYVEVDAVDRTAGSIS